MSVVATDEQAVTVGGRYHRVKPYAETDRALCGVPVRFVLERKPVAEVVDADRCRRCWWTPRGARLERSALQEYAGVRATADGGVCPWGDDLVLKDERIVEHGGHWGHAACWARVHE